MPPVRFQPLRFEGLHCTLTIDQPASEVILVQISGWDVGEFGSAPLLALEDSFDTPGRIDLFIDARDVQAASIHVSGEWAQWLAGHKDRLRSVTMLTGSRYIQVTAEFVRRFAELQGIMTLLTSHEEFDSIVEHMSRSDGATPPLS